MRNLIETPYGYANIPSWKTEELSKLTDAQLLEIHITNSKTSKFVDPFEIDELQKRHLLFSGEGERELEVRLNKLKSDDSYIADIIQQKKEDIFYINSPFHVNNAYDTDGSILDAPTEIDILLENIDNKIMSLNSENNLLTISLNDLFYNITAVNPENIDGNMYYSYDVNISNGDKYNDITINQVTKLITNQIEIKEKEDLKDTNKKEITIKDLAVGQIYYDRIIDEKFRASELNFRESVIEESNRYGDTPEYGKSLTEEEVNRIRTEDIPQITIKINSFYDVEGILMVDTSYGEILADEFVKMINNGDAERIDNLNCRKGCRNLPNKKTSKDYER